MSDRKSIYIEAFNNADIEKKKRSIKAIEAYGKLDGKYIGVGEKVDSITKILEEVYPSKWDIVLKKNIERKKDINGDYHYPVDRERPFTLEFIIHFPIIIITNTKKEIHTITDLYIKLNPTNGEEGFSFWYFEGKRMSATKEEIHSNYQHSHLSARRYLVKPREEEDNSAFTWKGFCLGSSEINQALTLLGGNYTENIFKLFLMQLDEYLNWESIEGTPHIHMSNVLGTKKASSLPTRILQQYYNRIKEREDKKEVDFIMEKGQIKVIQNEKFEEFLRVWEVYSSYDVHLISRKDSRGNYYKYQFASADIDEFVLSPEESLETISFLFRGERVRFEIKESTRTEENKQFYLHKQIKEYVTENIEKGIKTQRLRSHITKSLSAIDSLSGDTRQNRLFVPNNS